MMPIFDFLFKPAPIAPTAHEEVDRLLKEMVKIGVKEDYLSEHPGGSFNANCRHVRARQIGQRLNELGGIDLMMWSYKQIRKKVGKALASHLEYAWADIGEWKP